MRSRRESSNSTPKVRNPGPAGTHSQHLCGLAGASVELESTANGIGMTAHLRGLAAAATSTGINLGASRQNSLREVRAECPRTAHCLT